MIRIVSYCTPAHAEPMRLMLDSAVQHGAGAVHAWTRSDLEQTDFYRRHRTIFDAERGAGYWAWKPFYILQALREADDGDILIYNDAGRPENPYVVDRPLAVLADWAVAHRGGMLPGAYIPQWGANRQWTKGECFRAMRCDTAAIRDHPQVQATYSLWQKHDRSMAFVSEWLRWCVTPAAISDEKVDPLIPDAPDFIDHRFDQSVLTNLALRDGLCCFGDPQDIVVGKNCGSAVDKRIGMLIDRVRGDRWAIRRRIALEDRKMRHRAAPIAGRAAPLRRVARYASSLLDATTHYR